MKYLCFFLLASCSVLAQESLDSIPLSITLDEEIVVTGQYSPTELKASVLPIRVITKEMIEKRAANTLTEIFQQESNIRISQDPVLGTSMTMNGLSGIHIKILIDGVPMIGRSDGNLDLDRIQVQDIERIEIIENAMSVAYGTNALGGTINIITKKRRTESWDVRLMGQIQSNKQYNTGLSISGKWKDLSADFSYNFNHFDGFSTDTLRSQSWNPKQQHAFTSKLDYKIPTSLIHLFYQFNYLNEIIDNKGVIKLNAFPSLSYAKDYDFITITQEHSLAVVGYLDKKKKYYLDALVSFNDFERQKNAYFRSLNENTEPDEMDELDSDTTAFQAWNIRATIASKYDKKIDFQAGLAIRYDYTSGARIAQNRAEIGDYAVFANLRYKPFRKLYLDGGIRVSYNTLAKVPFTYSFGLKWNLMDGMNIRCSYARGIRTPSLKELYLDFVDINHHVKGNPNLQPEYAHNVRVGWSYDKFYEGGHIANVSLDGFYNYINQQITLFNYALDSNGQYIVSPQSNEYAYFNLDKYQNWGINARLKYQFKGLVINFGATLIGHYNSLSEEYGQEVKPFQYTIEFSQEVSYHFEKIGLSMSLFRRDFDKQISYVATTNPITQETIISQSILDGYGLMDFTLSKSFFNKGLVFSVGVKNLLNVTTINQSNVQSAHGASGSTQSVGMGRVFFFRLICQPNNFIETCSEF